MGPKKGTKMDLNSFLNDESFGNSSWADDDLDVSSIAIPTMSSVPAPTYSAGHGEERGSYPQHERQEYPVPDVAPFKAKISNLSWNATEAMIATWFKEKLNMIDADIVDVAVPTDFNTGKVKGFAFITFAAKEMLQDALTLTGDSMFDRRVYMSVAAPPKEDIDWRGARAGGPTRMPREDVEIDWSSARGSGLAERPARKPRVDSGNFDFASARDQSLPERRPERKPRAPEPDLDWSVARGTGSLPERERAPREFRRPRQEGPELDWSSRGSGLAERPPRTERKFKKNEPEFDWSAARTGQKVPPRASKPAEVEEKKTQPTKSAFDVLAGDDEEKVEEKAEGKVEEKSSPSLEQATSALSVNEDEGWNVVKR